MLYHNSYYEFYSLKHCFPCFINSYLYISSNSNDLNIFVIEPLRLLSPMIWRNSDCEKGKSLVSSLPLRYISWYVELDKILPLDYEVGYAHALTKPTILLCEKAYVINCLLMCLDSEQSFMITRSAERGK